MISRRLSLALVATAALVSTAFQPSIAQMAQRLNSQSAAPLAASAATAVPALVPFSGDLTEPDGKPVSGETAITFLIFKDQTGGEPLFAETQAVIPDASGHYKVQLGATLASGLPADLFSTGEARWLEVQAAGQTPQPRVLMASVPYALKAADSATLGGLPASAFVLAGSKAAADLATAAVSAATTTASYVTTTGGTSGYLAEFSGASHHRRLARLCLRNKHRHRYSRAHRQLDVNGTALISGALTANGGATIGGSLSCPATGTATATAGFNSQATKIYTSAYNSSTEAVVQSTLRVDRRKSPATTPQRHRPRSTCFRPPPPPPATNTGFPFNANGTVNFAKGQTFPGTGNGTITAVTAGTGLTGGGTAGIVTLNVDATKVVTGLIAGTGLTGGGVGGNLALNVDPTMVPLLYSQNNNFTGNLRVAGTLVGGTVGTPSLSVIQPPGQIAAPVVTIQADDNGVARNAAEQLVIQGASDPTQQLLIGYEPQNAFGGGYATIQATWANVQNTGLLLQPNGGCVCIRTGTLQFQNPLVIGQGQGGAVADDWSTYSSRRFKTNIQTLPDALAKVEKLRGVSYTLKANGKHEIGVIAEEVGAVVPEVVTYEKNGVDARSVDYTRLTALLIEATKEQQTLIHQQQRQIKAQQVQIQAQQTQVARLVSQMRTVQAALKDSDRASSQAHTVAQLTMTR